MEQSDILRNLRIEQLTPMQEAAQDAYQSDKDLVLLSPTGSGRHWHSYCRWYSRSKRKYKAFRRWCLSLRANLLCR